jgi:RNA polymerase sigma-70 factor (ECF subfamily)
MPDRPASIAERIEALYWTESRRVLATLIRLLGDFDLAEEALQDAFVAAAEQWPRDGEPANPRAWLVSTGRFRAIDHLRRRARFDAALGELAARLDDRVDDLRTPDAASVQDDQLRLIFTCCHPALPPDAQVALALRTICGLTTEEIARAFLTGAPTVAQRIVRAKARIRAERIPYEVPSGAALAPRLDAVLRVISLVYTEGYAASSGAEMVRQDLSDEAIRMGRLLADLLPDPEALGLLALMLFGDARREARVSPTGDLVLLADQDRSRWHRERIDEAARVLARAVASGTVGPFMLQAAIAEAHTSAPTAAATDWPRIIGLYDLLLELDPSPVVALNRAVAVAMRDGPEVGLALIERILARGELLDYHLARSAQADLLRRSGRPDEARVAYEAALGLTLQDRERRFLERRLRELGEHPERS